MVISKIWQQTLEGYKKDVNGHIVQENWDGGQEMGTQTKNGGCKVEIRIKIGGYEQEQEIESL